MDANRSENPIYVRILQCCFVTYLIIARSESLNYAAEIAKKFNTEFPKARLTISYDIACKFKNIFAVIIIITTLTYIFCASDDVRLVSELSRRQNVNISSGFKVVEFLYNKSISTHGINIRIYLFSLVLFKIILEIVGMIINTF